MTGSALLKKLSIICYIFGILAIILGIIGGFTEFRKEFKYNKYI